LKAAKYESRGDGEGKNREQKSGSLGSLTDCSRVVGYSSLIR
jgi:hypothetical protein